MKNGTTKYFLIALILCLSILTACKDDEAVSAAPTAENTATAAPTETPTEEPTETPEPTDTATPTPEPTDTATATPTPEPTDTATPTRTPTPEPTETPEPTNTAVPPTSAPAATNPPAATAEPTAAGDDDEFPLPMPSGAPASEWNGMPIMPQATAGEQGDGSYYFITPASALTVQSYYSSQMITRGWVLFASTIGQYDNIILIFQEPNTGETASVLIFTVDANTRYVMLVR